MISEKYSGISILLIIAILFSLVAVVAPVEPVQAAAPTSVTVTSPTTASPATIAAGATVTVNFTVSDNLSHTNAQAFVYQGSTEYHSTATTIAGGTTTYSFVINTVSGAPAGFYNCYVIVEGTTSATQSNAVYIDTTLPVAGVTNAVACWSTNQYVTGTTTPNAYTVSYSGTKAGSVSLAYVVQMSIDGGANYTIPLYSGSAAPGTYTLTTSPYALSITTFQYAKIRCRVTDVATGLVSNYAETPLFYILPNPTAPTLSYPNTSGLSFNGGATINITGTIYASGSTAAYMLSMHPTGSPFTGTYENITAGWQNVSISGSYAFTKPWVVSTSGSGSSNVIALWTRDCAGNVVYTAGLPFTIVPIYGARAVVNWPSAAATLYTCATGDNVTFTLSGGSAATTDCVLEYSTDNISYSFLANAPACPAGRNFVMWPHSGITAGTNYLIRVTATNNGVVTYSYSSTFIFKSLGGAPTITLQTPNGGESLTGGTTATITYVCNDTYDTSVPITYSIHILASGSDNGTIANFTLRNANGASSTYSWAVPNWTGSNYKIRISATDPCGNSIFDDSDSVFSITAGCPTITSVINLYPGNNQISLPLMPVSTDINSVLSGISDPSLINSVMWYNNGSWYAYVPGVTAALSTMEAGRSYWINIKGTPGTVSAPASVACTLTVTGRKCVCGATTPTSFTYNTTGWNAVGFKSTIAATPLAYFQTCGATPIALPIYYYDGPTQVLKSQTSCSTNLAVGQGYWLFLNGPLGILFPCD